MITGTDWLHAATQFLVAAAWPLGILGVFLIFRKPVRDTLSHLIKLRFGNLELEIDQARAEAAASASVAEALVDESQEDEPATTRRTLVEYYAQRVLENPLNAVLEAYIDVERRLDQALEDHGQSAYVGTRKLDVTELAALGVQTGILSSVLTTPIQALTVLRNSFLHGTAGVSVESAQRFISLADGVLHLIDLDVKRYEAHHPRSA